MTNYYCLFPSSQTRADFHKVLMGFCVAANVSAWRTVFEFRPENTNEADFATDNLYFVAGLQGIAEVMGIVIGTVVKVHTVNDFGAISAESPLRDLITVRSDEIRPPYSVDTEDRFGGYDREF